MYKTDIEGARKYLMDFVSEYASKNLTDEMSEGIQKNLVEQQLNGLSKEKYMLKWGKHQMRQIIRGLNLQYKVNFRDSAV